jgi:hypothetical protein
LEDRVRAYIFLCMLAYHVEWHMREAWRELMFADEDLQRKKHRDPVAAAVRSDAALEKITRRTLADGSPGYVCKMPFLVASVAWRAITIPAICVSRTSSVRPYA